MNSDIEEALADVMRLREDYNEGRNGITSADVWNAHNTLADLLWALQQATGDEG